MEQGQFKSFVGVSAQQPLLKGFTHGAPMASVKTAFEDRIIAFHEYRRHLMTAVTQAEAAYWNLGFAQQVPPTWFRLECRWRGTSSRQAQEAARVGRMSDLDVR